MKEVCLHYVTQPLLVEENFTLGRTEKETSQFERLPIQLGVLPTPRAPGGLLDVILDGDVPSRFQKHTRSLYQFFQNVYPIFQKYIPDFIPIFRKCIPDPIPIAKIAKIDTVRYTKIVKNDTLPDGTSPYPKYV